MRVHELFVAQAEREPCRPAVVAGDLVLTYGELLSRSRAWAGCLQALGAGPNGLIAIVMQKGWEQVVAVLGVLQSGAAYLPIDAGVPQERLSFLLKDSGVEVVLTQSEIAAKFSWPSHVRTFCVDQETPEEREISPDSASPDDLAYVLYTSGSTGAPKGVMISHRGVVNCICETNRQFQVNAKDRALAITALHHDMSVYDIFGLLAAGGALVMPDARAVRSPDHWAELIEREGVTIWNSVPGFMEMLLDYAAGRGIRLNGNMRLVFLGGDWISLSAPGRIRSHFAGAEIVSVGGPTETTVWNIWYPVTRVDPEWRSIPYGHPIANTRYYILDEALRDCHPGEAGELCCSGVGLMKGYWKREDLTRSKFATHPETGERIYRTGDRGRARPDGEIEFLGRLDSQVKIGGQRIELGEIEANLLQHAGVKAAAVKVISVGSHQRLAAYVVPAGEEKADAAEFRAFLEARIPSYMIPAAFVTLGALPLNGNGKVDRSALPEPAFWGVAAKSEGGAKPETLEGTILSVWRRVLGREHIGRNDNFFDLGGNSLLLIEAHAELERHLGRAFPVTALFEFPSVASLTGHLEKTGPARLATSDMDVRSARRREALDRRRAAALRI